MIASRILFVCLQAIVVVAQTAPGFTPAVTAPLKVMYGTNEISPAGKEIPRAETAKAPTIFTPKDMISSTAKGLLIMFDPDVNVLGRSGYLHWLVPGVDLSGEKLVVPTTAPNLVKYMQPSPFEKDKPHRYTFLLYSQPNSFSIPPKVSTAALGFNLVEFATATGIGQPKAAVFMNVRAEDPKGKGSTPAKGPAFIKLA